MHQIQILLVEDNPGDALLIRELLKEAKGVYFQLAHVDRLDAAREYLLKGTTDVLLLDLGLPDAKGFEALTTVRKIVPALPIVILTGLDDEEAGRQLVSLGAQDYLIKGQVDAVLLTRVLRYAIERKQAEEATLASQRLAQSTIDSLNSNICVLDTNGTIIAVNKSWSQFAMDNESALSPSGIGSNYLDVCDATQGNERIYATQFAAGIKAVMRGDSELFELEYPCHSPQEKRWFIERVTPLANFESGQRMVVVAHENITALKLAEESLHLQSAALEAAANAIVITDIEGIIQWANPAFATLTGYTVKETIGKNPRNLIKSGMHNDLFYQNMWETILADKNWHGELINRRKDGSLYTEEQTITPVKNTQGKIDHFISIKHDITERKQAEDDRIRLLTQVRNQAQRTKQIMDTIPEGIVLLDTYGQIIQANPIAKRDLLVLAGENNSDIITNLGDRPLTELLESNNWQEVHAGGYVFDIIARVMTDSLDTEYWVLLINDVTEQKSAQRYQQAQERLATVGQLAAGIAHDFNNVMNVIMLYAQMLQNIPNLSSKHTEKLNVIYDQAQHAAKLITQILDFSRRSDMEQKPLDVLPLIKETVKLLEHTLPENISVSLTYDQNEYVVLADPTRLQQSLMNLALNARDAISGSGKLHFVLANVAVTTQDTIPLPDMKPGNWFHFTISDTGKGIRPEHLSRIFDPFFTTKEAGKGTGLGLAQVYGIVKQHSGFIDVHSQVDKGTTFDIYFPLIGDPGSHPLPTQPIDTFKRGRETVLLVEDNPGTRLAITEALTDLGYKVLTADEGKIALEILGTEGIAVDLVLTDLVMPGMDGARLVKMIQQQYVSLKTLTMTGHWLDEARLQTLQETEAPWIQKPFSIEQLSEKVRDVLDS